MIGRVLTEPITTAKEKHFAKQKFSKTIYKQIKLKEILNMKQKKKKKLKVCDFKPGIIACKRDISA